MKATPPELLPFIAAGAPVGVRDEEWIVSAMQQTPSDRLLVRRIGTSTLVRDIEATFVTAPPRRVRLRRRSRRPDDRPHQRLQPSRRTIPMDLRRPPTQGRVTHNDLCAAHWSWATVGCTRSVRGRWARLCSPSWSSRLFQWSAGRASAVDWRCRPSVLPSPGS